MAFLERFRSTPEDHAIRVFEKYADNIVGKASFAAITFETDEGPRELEVTVQRNAKGIQYLTQSDYTDVNPIDSPVSLHDEGFPVFQGTRILVQPDLSSGAKVVTVYTGAGPKDQFGHIILPLETDYTYKQQGRKREVEGPVQFATSYLNTQSDLLRPFIKNNKGKMKNTVDRATKKISDFSLVFAGILKKVDNDFRKTE